MRDNSGLGKGENNDRNPTLEDHAGQGDIARGSRMRNPDFYIGGDAKVRGEKASPSDRARGETGPNSRATAADIKSKR